MGLEYYPDKDGDYSKFTCSIIDKDDVYSDVQPVGSLDETDARCVKTMWDAGTRDLCKIVNQIWRHRTLQSPFAMTKERDFVQKSQIPMMGTYEIGKPVKSIYGQSVDIFIGRLRDCLELLKIRVAESHIDGLREELINDIDNVKADKVKFVVGGV